MKGVDPATADLLRLLVVFKLLNGVGTVQQRQLVGSAAALIDLLITSFLVAIETEANCSIGIVSNEVLGYIRVLVDEIETLLPHGARNPILHIYLIIIILKLVN